MDPTKVGNKPCDRQCGRIVSANTAICAPCKAIVESLKIAQEREPQEGATHIIMNLPSTFQEDMYRADGMLVASRQGDVVRWGHDIPTAQSLIFLNKSSASAFLHRLADVDMMAQACGKAIIHMAFEYARIEKIDDRLRYLDDSGTVKLCQPATIEIREGEGLIALPTQGSAARYH